MTKARFPSKVRVTRQKPEEGDRGGARDTYHTSVHTCNGESGSQRDCVWVERASRSINVEDLGASADEL